LSTALYCFGRNLPGGRTLHNWFGFLFSRFPAPGFKSTVQKIACDQLIFAPIFNPVFLLFVFGLEGRLSELPKVLEETWLEMTMKNWYLWVPSQAINFAFVPVQYQVLWANFTAVGWNTYLSWAAHKQEEKPKVPEVAA
jgi:protein Mpv17